MAFFHRILNIDKPSCISGWFITNEGHLSFITSVPRGQFVNLHTHCSDFKGTALARKYSMGIQKFILSPHKHRKDFFFKIFFFFLMELDIWVGEEFTGSTKRKSDSSN